MENTDDTFLALWLDGKLSDEQLREKVSTEDFAAYLQLRESLSSFEVKNPDMDANYAAIKRKKIESLDKKPEVIPLFRYAAVAAMLLVFFGLYQLFVFTNDQTAGFGETRHVFLSDNSFVSLSAKSEMSYPPLFRYNRTLKLDGEAYFEVAKGSTFTVKTQSGSVKVLGTKFNVISHKGFLEVVCYEGKVKVSNDRFCKILAPGQAVRYYDKTPDIWIVTDKFPSWTKGESGFRNMPLKFVIDALENQYHQKIQFPDAMADARFTGSFTHHNLRTALQSVCIPMNLKFNQEKPGKITISE